MALAIFFERLILNLLRLFGSSLENVAGAALATNMVKSCKDRSSSKLGMTYENACCEKPTFISTKPDFEEHISDGHIFKFSWIRSAFGICRFGDVTFPQRLKRTFHANVSSQIILWMFKILRVDALIYAQVR